MTDFLKIAKSIVVRFVHICAYGVETVNSHLVHFLSLTHFISLIFLLGYLKATIISGYNF